MASLFPWNPVHYSVYSVFRSCLHSFLCNPYIPFNNLHFSFTCMELSVRSEGDHVQIRTHQPCLSNLCHRFLATLYFSYKCLLVTLYTPLVGLWWKVLRWHKSASIYQLEDTISASLRILHQLLARTKSRLEIVFFNNNRSVFFAVWIMTILYHAVMHALEPRDLLRKHISRTWRNQHKYPFYPLTVSILLVATQYY